MRFASQIFTCFISRRGTADTHKLKLYIMHPKADPTLRFIW